MASDGVLAGTNWTADLAGIENDPNDLQDQILDRMPPDMIERYRDQLQKGINDQNESE